VNRTYTRGVGAVAAVAMLALGAAACGSNSNNNASSTSGTAVKIGFMGDLTGANKALGININNGAKLAIDEYNATNPATKITLVNYDSQGDPKQATSLAPKAISDGIVGLVGPAFSGETNSTGPLWQEAGVPFVSASATRVSLAQNGWSTFHRVLGDDLYQGSGVANFITKGLKIKSVAVIDDASEYGQGLANQVATQLKTNGATVAIRQAVAAQGTTVPNYSSVINAIKGANVGAVFYGGYYAQAGPFAKQLKDGGVTAKFLSGDGANDPAFVTGAGAAANGAYLSCACAAINASSTGPAKTFYTNYKAAFNTDPGTYSGEGYDAATIFINGIKAGKVTRADLAPYVSGVDFTGVTKQIKFQSNGNISATTIYMYKVENGKITVIGTTDTATG
jgi:branched-chain amino acid transport system substrate-binding protein